MRFVIAPDSFKGSLTAKEAGLIMRAAIHAELPEALIHLIPMADGGEGTVDTIVEAKAGNFIDVEVAGPLGNQVSSRFGCIDVDGTETAVMEVANICGLLMLDPEQLNPYETTTRGLGEMIRIALDRGFRKFVIGLGGCATNDGGIGMLTALGARFTDRYGKTLKGTGQDLLQVAHADLSELDGRLRESSITAACDVTNPLTGPSGASVIFGPQKGASPQQIRKLDDGMARYAEILERSLPQRLSEKPGSGAAGGLGFALMCIGAEMESGAELIGRITEIKRFISRADIVLTGEGRSDDQTVYGKLPFRVAEWAKAYAKPTILISGSVDVKSKRLQESFAGCFSITSRPATLEACMADAAQNLEHCTRNVVRLLSHKEG